MIFFCSFTGSSASHHSMAWKSVMLLSSSVMAVSVSLVSSSSPVRESSHGGPGGDTGATSLAPTRPSYSSSWSSSVSSRSRLPVQRSTLSARRCFSSSSVMNSLSASSPLLISSSSSSGAVAQRGRC